MCRLFISVFFYLFWTREAPEVMCVEMCHHPCWKDETTTRRKSIFNTIRFWIPIYSFIEWVNETVRHTSNKKRTKLARLMIDWCFTTYIIVHRIVSVLHTYTHILRTHWIVRSLMVFVERYFMRTFNGCHCIYSNIYHTYNFPFVPTFVRVSWCCGMGWGMWW